METLIKQGAEGRVFQTIFLDKPTIVKERFTKKYRHPELDAKLTKERYSWVCCCCVLIVKYLMKFEILINSYICIVIILGN